MLGKRVSTGNLQGAVSGPDSGEGVRNQDTFDGENGVRRKHLSGADVCFVCCGKCVNFL